jgi:hypothetical protein
LKTINGINEKKQYQDKGFTLVQATFSVYSVKSGLEKNIKANSSTPRIVHKYKP